MKSQIWPRKRKRYKTAMAARFQVSCINIAKSTQKVTTKTLSRNSFLDPNIYTETCLKHWLISQQTEMRVCLVSFHQRNSSAKRVSNSSTNSMRISKPSNSRNFFEVAKLLKAMSCCLWDRRSLSCPASYNHLFGLR